MPAIVFNTRFDTNNYRRADGTALAPGTLFTIENGNGTVYVVNALHEKQPVNYAGFMKYYKASEEEPFSKVITLTSDEAAKYPEGSLITETTPAATLTEAKSKKGQYLIYGILLIGAAILLVKYFKKGKK